MDITSPKLLKLKGALFLLLGLLSGGLMLFLIQPFPWQVPLLLGICVWACCRAYYFCFYVMQHYAEPDFKYAGLWDLFLYLSGIRKKSKE